MNEDKQDNVAKWADVKRWLLSWAHNDEERNALNSVDAEDTADVTFCEEYGLCGTNPKADTSGALVIYLGESSYDLYHNGRGVVGSYNSRGDVDVTTGHRMDIPEDAVVCKAERYLMSVPGEDEV